MLGAPASLLDTVRIEPFEELLQYAAGIRRHAGPEDAP